MEDASWLTSREAIHLVRTATPEQVDAWRTDPQASNTLKFVCWMRVHDPAGWRGLLRDLGMLDPEPLTETATDRAIRLWREDYWTDDALAKEVGLKEATVKQLRRTRLRESSWATRPAGAYRKAFRLLP